MSMWFVKSDTRSWGSLFVADRALMTVLVVAALVCLVSFVLQLIFANDDVVAGSKPAEAEVVSYMSVQSGDEFEKLATLSYEVDGTYYMASLKVGNVYSVLNPVGQRTTIYYLADRPGNALLRSVDAGRGGIPFGGLASIAGLLALGLAIWAALRATGAVYARQFGRPGSGRIDAINVTRAIRVFGRELSAEKARLVFVDNFGRQSKTLLQKNAYLDQWSVGDEIDLFVGPNRSWWEGDVGVRRTRPQTSTGPAPLPE